MSLFSSEVIAAFAAFMTAIATFMAAFAAWKMLKHEQFCEKNKILFLKHQSEVEHLQKLIASFAKVIALASLEWNDERNQKLDASIREIQFHVSILESLNTRISTDIVQWVREKDSDGKEISQVLYYELGNLHAITGEKHKEFLKLKMEELKKIQDKMFSSMTKI